MDSHLSSAVYTYDCMHKYACKELHTYTTLRVHIYIQITTHMPAGTNYTREPRVQYIFKYSQTCTALRAQLHINQLHKKSLTYTTLNARQDVCRQLAACRCQIYPSILYILYQSEGLSDIQMSVLGALNTTYWGLTKQTQIGDSFFSEVRDSVGKHQSLGRSVAPGNCVHTFIHT